MLVGTNLPVKNASANIVLGGVGGTIDEGTAKPTGVTVTFTGTLKAFAKVGRAELTFHSGSHVRSEEITVTPCP